MVANAVKPEVEGIKVARNAVRAAKVQLDSAMKARTRRTSGSAGSFVLPEV